MRRKYKQEIELIANHTYLPVHKRGLRQMMNRDSNVT